LKRILQYFFAAVVAIVLVACQSKSPGLKHSTPASISVLEARERISRDSVLVLDVRTPPEFTGPLGHINGAILIPLQELEQRLDELEPYKQEDIIVVCRSGNRSGKATIVLQKKGFKAINMEGGMLKWNSEK